MMVKTILICYTVQEFFVEELDKALRLCRKFGNEIIDIKFSSNYDNYLQGTVYSALIIYKYEKNEFELAFDGQEEFVNVFSKKKE